MKRKRRRPAKLDLAAAAAVTRRRLLLAAVGGAGAALAAGRLLHAPHSAVVSEAVFKPAAAPTLAMEEEPLPHDVHLASLERAVPAATTLSPTAPLATGPMPPLATVSPPKPPATTGAAAPAAPIPALPSVPPAVAPSAPAVPNSGEAAWLRHARPFIDTGATPAVAIVIDDLGLGGAATRRAIALDGAVTLALMTYAPRVERWAEAARASRHEILVHVPMQPINPKVDPGPRALTIGLSSPEILDRLRWGLSRLDGYVGINNHMGSRFTQDRAGMGVVMEEVKGRGLLFLDSVTIAHTVGPATAAPLGIPFAERNVFLDDVATVAGVSRQIAVLEQVARRHGSAIAIGHPHPATLAVLAQWLPGAATRGIAVVPLTSVMRRQAMRA